MGLMSVGEERRRYGAIGAGCVAGIGNLTLELELLSKADIHRSSSHAECRLSGKLDLGTHCLNHKTLHWAQLKVYRIDSI